MVTLFMSTQGGIFLEEQTLALIHCFIFVVNEDKRGQTSKNYSRPGGLWPSNSVPVAQRCV